MKMLVAVDGSDAATQAVKHVLTLAEQGLGVSVVLVNVQEPASLYEVMTAHDPDVIREVRGSAGADLLAPAEALLEASGVAFESEVAGGEPANLIVELAERYGCDAIVLGAPGEDSDGDVMQAVLRHSPVAVTVVPRPAPAFETASDTGEEQDPDAATGTAADSASD
jgi:nucleotide-binding universal stress UspA family protein